MGHTAIMDGLWYKFPAYVKYLVGQGAKPPLGHALRFSMIEHLQFELNVNTLGKEKLLEIDATFKQRRASRPGRHRQSEVMAATNNGDTGAVQRLIAQGADVNAVHPHVNTFSDGHTPLLVAARDNHPEIVRELLDANAQVRVVGLGLQGIPDPQGDLQRPARNPAHDPGSSRRRYRCSGADQRLHAFARRTLARLYGMCRDAARRRLPAGPEGHDGKTPLQVAIDVYGPDADIVKRIREKVGTTPATPLVGGQSVRS